MNKFIFILVFSLLCFIGNAQPSEGKVFLGGSITYINPTTDNADALGNPNGSRTSTKNLMVSLQAGYFLTDNFVLGITTSYVDNKTTQENIPLTKTISDSKTWYYGLFGRTYTKVTEKIYFTNAFSFSIRTGNNNNIYNFYKPDSTTTSSLNVRGYSFGYAPGFSYFIKPCIAINASVGGISYDHYITTITSGPSTNTSSTNSLFSINLPFSNFNIGVNFLIGKVKSNGEIHKG